MGNHYHFNYIPPYRKLKEEEQLKTTFSHLKQCFFEKYGGSENIKDKNQRPIKTFYEFLKIINSKNPIVLLYSTGNVAGYAIDMGEWIEIDFSLLREQTKNWDRRRGVKKGYITNKSGERAKTLRSLIDLYEE